MSDELKKSRKTKTEAEIIENAPVETREEPVVTNHPVTPKSRTWRIGGVFWGSLLMLIGGLLLLGNLGVMDVNFANLWQLWPVLVIGAGASLLALRGWVGALVSVLLMVALFVLVVAVTVKNSFLNISPNVTTTTQTVVPTSADIGEGVTALDLSVKTGAAEVDVSSNEDTKYARATMTSGGLKLNDSYNRRGDTQFMTLTTDTNRRFWIGPFRNDLALDVTRSLPVSLHFDMGAATLRGDLSGVQLQALDVSAGASTIDLKLGSRAARQDISLEAGASTVTLHVPKDAGVRVHSESGLSSTNFDGVSKRSDGLFESNDFDSAESKITIRSKLGASSFTIKRY